jgi:hypothetical protein
MSDWECPFCKTTVDYSLIPVSRHPDSEACCYDCLPDDAQKAYDKFFGTVSPEEQKRNDAMERGDELRDRAKDERHEKN